MAEMKLSIPVASVKVKAPAGISSLLTAQGALCSHADDLCGGCLNG